jgi:hypothetical protein
MLFGVYIFSGGQRLFFALIHPALGKPSFTLKPELMRHCFEEE